MFWEILLLLWGVFLFVLERTLELIKLILWRSNNQTYHLDPWDILRFPGVAFSILCSLGFHLIRWRVKAQQILSTRSWGSKPSLLSGFITIVGEVHIIWYQSFGSKASLTIFYFCFHISLLYLKKKRRTTAKKSIWFH